MEKKALIFFETLYDNLEEITRDWLDSSPITSSIDGILRPWFECWTHSNQLFSIHWRLGALCFFEKNLQFTLTINKLRQYRKLSLTFVDLLQFKLYSSNIMEDRELCFLNFKYNYVCDVEKLTIRIFNSLLYCISSIPSYVQVFNDLKREYSLKSTFSRNILDRVCLDN